jgi:GNAT superfamily N-acetyltransferase
MNALVITPFAPQDQDAAKTLILRGLEEHWGTLDPSLNPDLNDITASYANGVFLVAWLDGAMVGTGALVPEEAGVGRIVRMSVVKEMRRMGIASRMLAALVAHAREQALHTLVLETTETWDDAVAFYLRHGFRITHHADGDAHFVRML